MIQITKLCRNYPQGDDLVRALDQITFTVDDREFVAITGESGSGKSTLLHLLGGLDRPDSGQLIVNGAELQTASEKELTRYRAYDLGIVFQFFNLLPTLNLLENVTLPLLFQGVKTSAAQARAREMLALVGLESRAHRFMHQLSGGEIQRTAVARALVHRPKLMLADEPTGNLDGQNAETVMEVFRKIAAESLTTLILVTHSHEIARLAAREIRLQNGRILHDSKIDSFAGLSGE